MTTSDARRAVLSALDRLHAEIDREAARLASRNRDRLRCHRGCSGCCLDELTVSAVEAEGIREAHSGLLANSAAHAPGACAFLDAEGACRIYANRPSVCRSQGLPLRMFFENEADEIEERRDICPLNLEGGPPLGELEEEDCWLIGPVELELLELDRRLFGEFAPRVALRSLFENPTQRTRNHA